MTPHRLTRYCGQAVAFALVFAGITEATAQFLPTPGQASRFPPAPGQSSPFPPPPGQQPQRGPASTFPSPPRQSQSVCENFPGLRQEAEKGAAAIQAAGKRKAPREEVCGLFKNFAVKEGRMVQFLVKNQTACGVPPEAVKRAQANRAQTLKVRNQVCSNAPSGPPPGPSLSDALGAPIVADDPTTKSKGGTFDTLTGNALAQ